MSKRRTNKWLERLNSLSSLKDQVLEERKGIIRGWNADYYLLKDASEIKRVMQPLLKEIKILENNFNQDFTFIYYPDINGVVDAVDIIFNIDPSAEIAIKAKFRQWEPFKFQHFLVHRVEYEGVREDFSHPHQGWDFKEVEDMEGVMDLVVEYIAEHKGLKF